MGGAGSRLGAPAPLAACRQTSRWQVSAGQRAICAAGPTPHSCTGNRTAATPRTALPSAGRPSRTSDCGAAVPVLPPEATGQARLQELACWVTAGPCAPCCLAMLGALRGEVCWNLSRVSPPDSFLSHSLCEGASHLCPGCATCESGEGSLCCRAPAPQALAWNAYGAAPGVQASAGGRFPQGNGVVSRARPPVKKPLETGQQHPGCCSAWGQPCGTGHLPVWPLAPTTDEGR